MSLFIDLNHQLSHGGVENSKRKFCFFCNKVPNIKEELREHISSHMKYKPIKCNTCNNFFESQRLFELHIETMIREKKSPCSQNYSNLDSVWIEFILDRLTNYSDNIGWKNIKRNMLEDGKLYMTHGVGGQLYDILAGRPINEKLVVHSVSEFLASNNQNSSSLRQSIKNFINIGSKILKRYDKNKSKVNEKDDHKKVPSSSVDKSHSKEKDILKDSTVDNDCLIVPGKSKLEKDDVAKSTFQKKLYFFLDVDCLNNPEFKATKSITDNCYMCSGNYISGNLKIQHIFEKHTDFKNFLPFSCTICNENDKKDVSFASADLFKKHCRQKHPEKEVIDDSKGSMYNYITLNDGHYNFIDRYNEVFSKCFIQNIKRKCTTEERSDNKKFKASDIPSGNNNKDTLQVSNDMDLEFLNDVLGDIKRNSSAKKPEILDNNTKKKINIPLESNRSIENSIIKNTSDVSRSIVTKLSETSNGVKNNFLEKESVTQINSNAGIGKKNDFTIQKMEKIGNLLEKGSLKQKNTERLKSTIPRKKEIAVKEQKTNPFLRKNGTAYNGYSYYVQQCGKKCKNCVQPVIPKFKKIICRRDNPWYLNYKTPFWYLFSSNHINIILVSSGMFKSCRLCDKKFPINGCGMIKHVVEEHLSLDKFLFKCRLCDLETNNITQLAYHWKANHNSTGMPFSNNLIWRCSSIPLKYPDNYSIEINKDSASKIETYVKEFVKCFPLLEAQSLIKKK